MFPEDTHERRAGHLCQLGALADPEAVLANLLDDPEQAQLASQRADIGLSRATPRQRGGDIDGAGRCGCAAIIAPKAPGDDAGAWMLEYEGGVEDVVTLFRPTGPKALALAAASGWKRWPHRLPDQPIFYPVTNEAHARDIAERWNVKESGAGFVTRFAVPKVCLDRYERHVVGAREHEEYWIPAEELEAFNDAIVGEIEVVGAFRAEFR